MGAIQKYMNNRVREMIGGTWYTVSDGEAEAWLVVDFARSEERPYPITSVAILVCVNEKTGRIRLIGDDELFPF